MTAAYRDDLAYIHDAGFGGFARAAGPVLVDALRRGRITEGLVIDLGCGSGILSGVTSGSGYGVLGIDISEGMVALARKHVPRGEFRVESLLSAELPRCVAVAAVGECLNYLFDEGNTTPKLVKLFRRIHRALAPGGLFILDVAEPGRVPGPGPRRTYMEGKDWAVLVTNEEDRRHRFLTRRITSFRRVGELYRRDHEVHRQRLIARSEVTGQLRGIGFRVRSLRGYGPLRFGPGHAGLLARKPSRRRGGVRDGTDSGSSDL
jgi:SAM-dependent methyltransferase